MNKAGTSGKYWGGVALWQIKLPPLGHLLLQEISVLLNFFDSNFMQDSNKQIYQAAYYEVHPYLPHPYLPHKGNWKWPPYPLRMS